MDPVVIVHVALGLLLLAACVVVAAWGFARAGQIGGGGDTREARAFAQVLQLSHTLVFATGLAGIALALTHHRANDPLHGRVYGPFMVVAIIAAYGFRVADHRANVRVFATCALVILALGIRAAFTGR